ncbi:hypothetical protein THRCLA_21444 [Thraustotheca clavata]|uniref:Secreted protein n=1 Tax=Thraustotheca clavata TaxID=74557 RepID=A0A1V9ZWG0_9STRA|nr:hypothetical protein THRCLA_21444 [Thraustotheca clavata]
MSWVLLTLIQLLVSSLLVSSKHIRMSNKIDSKLITAYSHTDRINVMVQLYGSTTSVENSGSGSDHTEYVDRLQAFTQERQQAVKDLLSQFPNEYEGEPKFFWITNQVSIHQATAALVMELAELPSVQAIRGEIKVSIQHHGELV